MSWCARHTRSGWATSTTISRASACSIEARRPGTAGSRSSASAVSSAACAASAAGLPQPPADGGVTLIRNATILTASHGTIPRGSILIRDGKIAAVGADVTEVSVDDDGRDVTGAFALGEDGRFKGLVTGLDTGPNVLTARLPDGRAARITITNHPIGGPVFSGAQVMPWRCTTVENPLSSAVSAQTSDRGRRASMPARPVRSSSNLASPRSRKRAAAKLPYGSSCMFRPGETPSMPVASAICTENPLMRRVMSGQNEVSSADGMMRPTAIPHVCGPLPAGKRRLLKGIAIHTA